VFVTGGEGGELFALPPIGPAALAAEQGLAAFAADPVKAFRFKSQAQRDFARALSRFRETALRSGNQAGKTTIGAFCFVAIARGCVELDGVQLPLLGAPNSGVVLCKGRAMAQESVIRAYLSAIGDWPHHVERNGNNTEAIWVKPNRSKSDEWRDWSRIRFFVEGGQSVAGMRLDWVHADEPPDWVMWQELRMRSKANRHFVRAITFTPIDKREWKPVRDDFKGAKWPEGREGRVELTMSVFDNEALSPEHKKSIEQDSRGPLQKAKLYGEYIDLTGTNPFDAAGLKKWEERCVAGAKHPWMTAKGVTIEVEVWDEPQNGANSEPCLVVCDPSAGIWDEAGEHDPCEMVVVGRKTRDIKARFNGYIQANELGRLAAHYARLYGDALLVWERNSGYGEAFYLGVGNYGNVYVEHHRDARHLPLSERLGWLTTATSRGTVIGALQKAVIEDGLRLYSMEAVTSLGDVVIDRNGRIEAGAGCHDEDMIVLGLAAHLLETMPYMDFAAERKGSDVLREQLGLRPRPRGDANPVDFQSL